MHATVHDMSISVKIGIKTLVDQSSGIPFLSSILWQSSISTVIPELESFLRKPLLAQAPFQSSELLHDLFSHHSFNWPIYSISNLIQFILFILHFWHMCFPEFCSILLIKIKCSIISSHASTSNNICTFHHHFFDKSENIISISTYLINLSYIHLYTLKLITYTLITCMYTYIYIYIYIYSSSH